MYRKVRFRFVFATRPLQRHLVELVGDPAELILRRTQRPSVRWHASPPFPPFSFRCGDGVTISPRGLLTSSEDDDVRFDGYRMRQDTGESLRANACDTTRSRYRGFVRRREGGSSGGGGWRPPRLPTRRRLARSTHGIPFRSDAPTSASASPGAIAREKESPTRPRYPSRPSVSSPVCVCPPLRPRARSILVRAAPTDDHPSRSRLSGEIDG